MSSSAEKLSTIVNSTYVGFALSVCKDVGILEVLMESHLPLTSQEIADKKDLKERYVRELLGSLATAEVVHVSTDKSGALVYHLDDDEKALLRTCVMAFISGPARMIEPYDIVKTFMSRTGPNGARLSDGAQDFVAEYSNYMLDTYVDSFVKYVDGLKDKLENGIDVLEVGCGRGCLLKKFALMFPKSTFTASDNVDFLLDQLKTKLGHIPNIKYAIIDLCYPSNSPNKKYDWVYCTNAMHDVPNPPEALKNIRKLIKSLNGMFTMIDIATSGSPMGDKGNQMVACMYAISSFFCVPESYIQENSLALGMCYGKQRSIDFLTAAGFDVKVVDLTYPTSLFVCE